LGREKLVRMTQPPPTRSKAWPRWTGFRGKTVWDWMQLFVVPLVLTVLGLSFAIVQQRLANEQEAARQQAIEEQRAHNATTQAYLDVMRQLLLDKGLATSNPGDKVSALASAQTLSTLKSLDEEHNQIIMTFLRESGLLSGLPGQEEVSVLRLDRRELNGVDLGESDLGALNLRFTRLRNADLHNANFAIANLSFADLHNANLKETDLRDAALLFANLDGAYLAGADLSGARLRGADLSGANLTTARNLAQNQIDQAGAGDVETKLPEGLARPKWWSDPYNTIRGRSTGTPMLRDSRLGASLVDLKDIEPDLGDEIGIPKEAGVSNRWNNPGALVYDVQPTSPADDAGLMPGDVIVDMGTNLSTVNKVRNLQDLKNTLDGSSDDKQKRVVIYIQRYYSQEGWVRGYLDVELADRPL